MDYDDNIYGGSSEDDFDFANDGRGDDYFDDYSYDSEINNLGDSAEDEALDQGFQIIDQDLKVESGSQEIDEVDALIASLSKIQGEPSTNAISALENVRASMDEGVAAGMGMSSVVTLQTERFANTGENVSWVAHEALMGRLPASFGVSRENIAATVEKFENITGEKATTFASRMKGIRAPEEVRSKIGRAHV